MNNITHVKAAIIKQTNDIAEEHSFEEMTREDCSKAFEYLNVELLNTTTGSSEYINIMQIFEKISNKFDDLLIEEEARDFKLNNYYK